MSEKVNRETNPSEESESQEEQTPESAVEREKDLQRQREELASAKEESQEEPSKEDVLTEPLKSPISTFLDRLDKRLEPIDEKLSEWLGRLLSRNYPMYITVAVAIALFVPALGSVGLWDCWEPHYGEVARSMYTRGDYWHPYWESSWFFSKPIGLFWLMIGGMALLRVDAVTEGVFDREAWAMRLGTTTLSILCVFFVYIMLSRVFGKRTALFGGVVMATSPLYFFLSKQAITDMPFVASTTIAISAFIIGWFTGEEGRMRRRWIVFAYAMTGVAVLMKGIPGAVLPAMVIFIYIVISWEWKKLISRDFIISSLIGIPLFLLIALPWYIVMFIHNPGKNCTLVETLQDQFKHFWHSKDIKQCAARDENNRTFFERFFIHDHLNRLTSGVHGERGHFDFFLLHIGVGFFPWSAIAPVAAFRFLKTDLRKKDPQTRTLVFILVWALVVFAFYAVVTTKFHHYIFPLIPPLSMIVGVYLNKFVEKRNMAGLGVYALTVTTLFWLIGRDIMLEPKLLPNLFVYKYEREYPESVSIFWFMLIYLIVAVVLMFAAYLLRRRKWFVGALFAAALVFASFNCWYLFNMLSPHWSQKYYFETYYRERSSPDAAIAAFLLNWRGETYYSKNTILQLKSKPQIRSFLNRNPQAEKYFITEQHRYSRLKERLPDEYKENLSIVDKSNNKYYLCRVDPLSKEQKEEINRKKREEEEKRRKEKEASEKKEAAVEINQTAGLRPVGQGTAVKRIDAGGAPP